MYVRLDNSIYADKDTGPCKLLGECENPHCNGSLLECAPSHTCHVTQSPTATEGR